MNRRQFFQKGFAALLLGRFENLSLAQYGKQASDVLKGGELLGQLPFRDEATVPMGRAFGTELDGRLYTDLSVLTPENAITATEKFYVRTRASELLTADDVATIRFTGLVERPTVLRSDVLIRSSQPMGTHLMECAGNARIIHFGLMSVAEWSGVSLTTLIEEAKPKPEATRVQVSGFDTYRSPSRSSLPGASWIFTPDDLKSSRAFLATAMNGRPLTKDHGCPVRLVVPSWCGCSCIKWVNEIAFVDDTAESTSQMREFASRTLQTSMPQLARDFQPAVIDQAAMPIRIEKWKVGKNIRYRIVGILWGGRQPVKSLEIQVAPAVEFVPVSFLRHEVNDPWSFWVHLWEAKQPGVYAIRLRIKEPSVLARRLDAGFYERSFEVTEVS